MKIKQVKLLLDEKTHKQLWKQKEEKKILLGKNITWEEFFIEAMNVKVLSQERKR